MSKFHVIKASTPYFIGIIIMAFGIYIFLTENTADMKSNSFYIILLGFAVALIGSRYGHKTLRERRHEEEGTPEKEKIEKSSQEAMKSSTRLEEIKKKERDEIEKLKVIQKEEEEEKKRLEEEKRKEEKAKASKEKSSSKSSKPESKSKKEVVKVLVCPDCGEENKYEAKFCDNCGHKLRP